MRYLFSILALWPLLLGAQPSQLLGVTAFNRWAPVTNAGPASTSWLTGTTLGATRNNFTGNLGCQLTNKTTLTVVSLGYYVLSGSTGTHHAVLWNEACNVLASNVLDYTGLSTGWYYVDVAVPPQITPGIYYLGISQVSAGDSFYDSDTSVTTTADVDDTQAAYGADETCPTSLQGTPNRMFGPVNFKYTKP